MTDKQILQYHDAAVMPRARIELRIVRRLLRELKREGYTVRIDDGGETTIVTDEGEALALLFNLDVASLYVDKAGSLARSWIYLVFGNDGWDVIADYSTSLTPLMDRVTEGEGE
jgi:hypothetical protein